MRLYEPGYKLQENEYLLKVRPAIPRYPNEPETGFLSKLTQKGELPKAFTDWGKAYDYVKREYTTDPPIQIHTEDFRGGWQLESWRFGQSQNWASVITPEGWTVEIYLSHFLDIVKNNTIINGVILGEFKWEANKLIKA
jgi:hypothetical protein